MSNLSLVIKYPFCHSVAGGSTNLETHAKFEVHACTAVGANLPLCAWFAATGNCLQVFSAILVLVYGSLVSAAQFSIRDSFGLVPVTFVALLEQQADFEKGKHTLKSNAPLFGSLLCPCLLKQLD